MTGVDVVEADTAAADLFAASVGAPAAAVGDAAELLHVDMDQLPGAFALVTVYDGAGGADQLACQRSARGQQGNAGPVQDSRDGPCANARRGSDAQRVDLNWRASRTSGLPTRFTPHSR